LEDAGGIEPLDVLGRTVRATGRTTAAGGRWVGNSRGSPAIIIDFGLDGVKMLVMGAAVLVLVVVGPGVIVAFRDWSFRSKDGR